MSGRRVLVIGLPFFGTRVAESLRSAGYDARYAPHPGRDASRWPGLAREIMSADAVYAIGSSIRIGSPLDLISRARKALLVHWVGTDVSVALDDWRGGRVSERVIRRSLHRADAPWLVQELCPLGIKAKERLLPVPVAIGSVLPLPEEFRILVYLPVEPQPDYDVEATIEVIRSVPDVRFAIVGGYAPPEPIANVDVLGFRNDMPEVYRSCVGLLRLMRHDGMSHSVIEAASFGRYVTWSYEMEGVQAAPGAASAAAAIRRLHEQFRAGSLEPNVAAATHMQTKYNHERLLTQSCRDLDRLLA